MLTPKQVDRLADAALFGNGKKRQDASGTLRDEAHAAGITFASIRPLYATLTKAEQLPFTIPAVNIRGMSFDFLRALFRTVISEKVGPFIIEIARSEMEYGAEPPADLAASTAAAALREGYRGPVYLQGDHYQVRKERNRSDEVKELERLIRESADAGFRNFDIDASTIVDLTQKTVEQQQAENAEVTAHLTQYIFSLCPEANIGGEIGEIGAKVSTLGDLRGFMSEYQRRCARRPGITKVAVQTGTSHGGIPNPDGTVSTATVDFHVLAQLSDAARREFGLAGVVQHGASTLPEELFPRFPESGAVEIHLSTEFQHIILNHQAFPSDVKHAMDAYLFDAWGSDRKSGETDRQFLYRNQKKVWGPFRSVIAHMPEDVRSAIRETLEQRLQFFFRSLRVSGTRAATDASSA